MITLFKKLFIICFIVTFSLCNAKDLNVVNVDQGVMKPYSIALSISDNIHSLKDRFFGVISNDLASTGLFRPIPQNAYMQNFSDTEQVPNYSVWRTINAEYLMVANLTNTGSQIHIKFALYDIAATQKIEIFSLSGNIKEWRKAAHLVANAIYERIIGEVGYFDTKILYVDVHKDRRGQKTHRLALMDQDGYNNQYLTTSNSIVLTPRFSPNGTEFSFFAYKEKIVNGRRIPLSAQVYRYDLKRKKMLRGLNLPGMTYAPRYSPDGRNLIFSLSEKTRNGRSVSSIFRYNLDTNRLIRITDARKFLCIDTSPCYSPDGNFIVFNSDRAGNQQLYIMNADGSNIRRLSHGKGRYATPVWSPRGDWIAFTKFGRDGFFIGIIKPYDTDSSTERMLASGYLVEGPTWSPNGRVIMYSQQSFSHKEEIYSVDITGYNRHRIKTPRNAIDPEWSTKINLQ